MNVIVKFVFEYISLFRDVHIQVQVYSGCIAKVTSEVLMKQIGLETSLLPANKKVK